MAGHGGWSGARYIEASSPEEEAAYAAIRASTTDVPKIAANTGIAEDIIAQIKTHLFLTEHDVPIGANQIVHGYFTADGDTAGSVGQGGSRHAGPLSRRSASGSLMAHEYVESHLMAAGMPYRSADPAAWVDDYQDFNAQHFGAHDVAPRAADGSFSHCGRAGSHSTRGYRLRPTCPTSTMSWTPPVEDSDL